MQMLTVVKKRKSIREYKKKDINKKLQQEIFGLYEKLPEINGDSDVDFEFRENGKEIIEKVDGLAGYYGHLIEAPHYFVIWGTDNVASFKYAGYVGEWLILNMTKMDLGTCWIDVGANAEKIKEVLGGKTDKKVLGLIAVGYPAAENVSEIYGKSGIGKLAALTSVDQPEEDTETHKAVLSGRKAIEEIVFLKKWGEEISFDEIAKRGYEEVFYYMRLAPSWGNRQPWKFILDGNQIILTIKKDKEVGEITANIEAGIAMLYLEVAMHGMGLPGSWDINKYSGEVDYEVPSDYYIAGVYSFN